MSPLRQNLHTSTGTGGEGVKTGSKEIAEFLTFFFTIVNLCLRLGYAMCWLTKIKKSQVEGTLQHVTSLIVLWRGFARARVMTPLPPPLALLLNRVLLKRDRVDFFYVVMCVYIQVQ